MTVGADTASPPYLGWPTKSLYGLSALGTATRGGLMGGSVLFFYNRILGVDASFVSLAILISLLIDAFWDPVVGQLSDNTRTRLGRRHPYVYGAIIPATVFFVLIFAPPMSWSDEGMFVYLLVMLIGARMFESLVEIPLSTLMPELSRDYDQRTSLAAWRYFFTVVIGRVLSLVLAYGVFLKGTKANHFFGQMNEAGYLPYAITVGVISVGVTLVTALSTQRFVPFMQQPTRRRAGFGEMARTFVAAAANRNFVALALSGFIFGIAVGITTGLALYFSTDFWRLHSDELFLIGLCAIPGGLVGVVAAPYWSRLMGKKLGCLIVFFMAILGTTVPIGLRLLGVIPVDAPRRLVEVVLSVDTGITGLLSTMGFIIVTAMLSDVVEAVQLKTGKRQEGVLFAADSLLRKITTSIAAGIPGLLLVYVQYPVGAPPGQVDMHILNHLATIYLPLVTVLYLCSTSMLMLYRIDRKQHEDNLLNIAAAATFAEEGDEEQDPRLPLDVIPSRT